MRAAGGYFTSDIPARIDRLPWSRFHLRLLVALAACWVLDGLEATILSNVQGALRASFGLSVDQVASAVGTSYLVGEAVGAIAFGHLADRFGRRRLFFVTLTVYFVGSAGTAAVVGSGATALWLLILTRVVAGAGIGGEYAAVNSMVDELVPAPYRGRADIAVNGTYWAGATLAALLQIPLLSGAIDAGIAWRVAVLLGPVLAIALVALRRRIPESPRWLVIHGRRAEAEAGTAQIEDAIRRENRRIDPVRAGTELHIRPVGKTGYLTLLRLLLRTFPRRAVLGLGLMITQSLLYNGYFFNYSVVLENYFGIGAGQTAYYYLPFALANLLGPLVLCTLFDTIGRRRMISRTYLVSGLLLGATAAVFAAGAAWVGVYTLAMCVAFFFTSAGASSGYLTISEIFPMEVRAKAFALFFAIFQAVGAIGPLVYSSLLSLPRQPDPRLLFVGFLIGAVLMLIGWVVARYLAVDAENTPLEHVARPLSAVRDTVVPIHVR